MQKGKVRLFCHWVVRVHESSTAQHADIDLTEQQLGLCWGASAESLPFHLLGILYFDFAPAPALTKPENFELKLKDECAHSATTDHRPLGKSTVISPANPCSLFHSVFIKASSENTGEQKKRLSRPSEP